MLLSRKEDPDAMIVAGGIKDEDEETMALSRGNSDFRDLRKFKMDG